MVHSRRMMEFQKLLDKMRRAAPSRALDREVHKIIGGKFALFAPRYTSDFEAAYGLLNKAEVTVLSLEGGWEPSCPAAHPAWAVRYYTKERPPTAGQGGWYGAIAAGVSPAIALCRAALVVLARTKHGVWVKAE